MHHTFNLAFNAERKRQRGGSSSERSSSETEAFNVEMKTERWVFFRETEMALLFTTGYEEEDEYGERENEVALVRVTKRKKGTKM